MVGEFYWENIDSESILISTMETSYLKNVLRMMKKRKVYGDDNEYIIFIDTLIRDRKLNIVFNSDGIEDDFGLDDLI